MNDAQADQLVDALRARFGGRARHERTAPGRYAIEVITDDFDGVTSRARQDRVWQVVDDTLDRDTSAGITLIMTYAPGDFDVERQLRELEEVLAR